MTLPSTYEHYRPVDGDTRDGIYRVVGTGEETITLLRVGDAAGRRVNTGHVITVKADELDRFEQAENPDGNRSLGDWMAGTIEMGYWSLRAFGQQLLTHPAPTALAVALVLAGTVGDSVLPLPEVGLDALILLGSAVLAYVGSGRL